MIWFLDGRYLQPTQAKIPVNDLSILRGYGIFDFLVTYNHKPFLLEDHIARLFNSAKLIKLPIPYSQKEIKDFVLETIKRNHLPSVTVRIVITGGVSQSNIFPEGKSSVAIFIEKRKPFPKDCYEKGIKVRTYEYLRFQPQAKHIDYLTAVVVKNEAHRQGCLEVLYTWQGQILECTTSNFYLIKDKTLVTTKNNILHGITKKVILKLAAKFMKVEERPVYLRELKTCDEALISASDKEIMPVIAVDKLKINKGKPGPYTKHLIQDFRSYTRCPQQESDLQSTA